MNNVGFYNFTWFVFAVFSSMPLSKRKGKAEEKTAPTLSKRMASGSNHRLVGRVLVAAVIACAVLQFHRMSSKEDVKAVEKPKSAAAKQEQDVKAPSVSPPFKKPKVHIWNPQMQTSKQIVK